MGLTITVRLVRSFEYRTFKNLVLRDVSPELTFKQLGELVQQKLASDPAFKIYAKNDFDTFKVFLYPHGAKTSNLIINLDHDEWIARPDQTLAEFSVVNETEISYFNVQKYHEYRNHPDVKW